MVIGLFIYLQKFLAMKQYLIFFISLVTFASCSYTSGSGNIVSETRSVEGFSGITVGGNFEVEVRIGPVTEVRVEADDNIMKYIETDVSGNTLKIRTKNLHNYSDVHMKLYITVPYLKSIKASASADVVVKDVLTGTGKISFDASSSAKVTAEVDAPEIESNASSSGTVNLRGKTRTYSAEASSAGDIRSFDLLSENTRVNVSSGASAEVHASVTLNATASSGGGIDYHGAASVNKSVSSGGSVEKKD